MFQHHMNSRNACVTYFISYERGYCFGCQMATQQHIHNLHEEQICNYSYTVGEQMIQHS